MNLNKMYACYEKNHANQWKLVVYYQHKPSVDPHIAKVIRSPFFDVLPEHLDENGNPNMELISKVFPAPIDKEEENGEQV